jgi:hypothetical protein
MAAVPLLAVAGCGTADLAPTCKGMPALPAVGVTFGAKPGTSYRLCVGTVCSTGGGSQGHLRVRLPDSAGARKVSVRFTATPEGASKPAVDERADIALHGREVNGRDCGPTTFTADLTYTPGKGLVRLDD